MACSVIEQFNTRGHRIMVSKRGVPMNAELKSFLSVLLDNLREQSNALLEAARKIPKLDDELLDRLEKARHELSTIELPATSTPRGHVARSLELRPFLAEYANDEPRQVSYGELSELIGLSEATIRVRISQSPHKGFVRYVRGRHLVVLRDPNNLKRILEEKSAQTQRPEDTIVLPKRAPKTTR